MIKFKNVPVAYGMSEVLFELNPEIKDEKLAVLIGPTGCGKTTALRPLFHKNSQTIKHDCVRST